MFHSFFRFLIFTYSSFVKVNKSEEHESKQNRTFLEKTTVEREKIFFPPEQFSAVLHRGDECWKCVKQPCLAAETVFEFLFPDELGSSCEFLLCMSYVSLPARLAGSMLEVL